MNRPPSGRFVLRLPVKLHDALQCHASAHGAEDLTPTECRALSGG